MARQETPATGRLQAGSPARTGPRSRPEGRGRGGPRARLHPTTASSRTHGAPARHRGPENRGSRSSRFSGPAPLPRVRETRATGVRKARRTDGRSRCCPTSMKKCSPSSAVTGPTERASGPEACRPRVSRSPHRHDTVRQHRIGVPLLRQLRRLGRLRRPRGPLWEEGTGIVTGFPRAQARLAPRAAGQEEPA